MLGARTAPSVRKSMSAFDSEWLFDLNKSEEN
jgi:hypothetical protein